MNPDTRLCRPLPKPFGHVASSHEDSGVLARDTAFGQHGSNVISPDPRPHRPIGTMLALAVIAATSLVGCNRSGDEEALSQTRGGCAAAVAEASRAREIADQVALLDIAIIDCRSYAALTAELARYPGITGYSAETFLELRCARVQDEAVRQSPACGAVIAPTTTIQTAAPPELVYVGETLDGRIVEIRPDADTKFVGSFPEVIQQTVDIAFESGCAGVTEQRDLWAARVDEPLIGDEASVYAKHADNVMAFIGCTPTAP